MYSRASSLALSVLSKSRTVSATLGCASSHSSVLSASSAAADACAAWKRCVDDDASAPETEMWKGLGVMTTARSTAVAALSTLGWLVSSHSSAVGVEAAVVGSVPNAHVCVASSASSVAEVLDIAVVVFPARKPGVAYRAAERCTPGLCTRQAHAAGARGRG